MRFTSSEAELAEALADEQADAELVVTINGKQYRGALVHDGHDGHGHGHAENDHD